MVSFDKGEYQLTDLMEQSPSSQFNSSSVKKLHAFYGTRRFIPVFTRACPYPGPDQAISSTRNPSS